MKDGVKVNLVLECKRAKEALTAAEARYRRLFETAKDGILILDAHSGLILDVNPFLVGLLDYTRDEFIGKTLWDIGLFRQIQESKEAFRELQDEQYDNLPLETRSGRRVNVEFVSNVYGVNGESVVQCNIRDITARQQTEEALRLSEERLKQAQHLAGMGVFDLELQSGKVIWSPRMFEIFGLPSDAPQPGYEDQTRFTHSEDLWLVEEQSVLRRAGKPIHLDHRIIRPSGEVRWVEVSGEAIFDNAGRYVRYLGVCQDITERKQAESTLREYERVVEGLDEMILVVDREYRYVIANRAFLNYRQMEKTQVIGHLVDEVVDKEVFGVLIREKMDECFRGNIVHYEMKYKFPNLGERDLLASYFPIQGHAGIDRIACILQDVTGTRRLEAQFLQAQKMEAVGRLAGGVAHDFNNILGVIMGYSDISLDLIEPEHPLNKYLSEINKASQRAALLTRRLLAFSRQQVIFPKVLDLNGVVRDVTSMLLRIVGEDIAIEFRATTPICSIRADPGQIEQILMNLVVNARDAMPTGGKIIIETGLAKLDEHYVSQHPGSHAGQQVLFSVSDTGCGMDESIKSKIFEPFFTTKPVGKGTGLGLSTVQGIVKQSEGYICVETEPGKGTTFKMFFASVSESAGELVFPYDEAEPPRGSETILVVEDDKALRELAIRLLRDGGYRVMEARNAEDALTVMKASELEIDLLFTDVVMPGQTGVELLAQAKLVHPNLRAVFMSGYPGDLVAHRGGLITETAFLEKPFTRRSLLRKVHSVLQSEPAK
ncbi:MAG: two-component sensory box histidine kinase/response regulator [Acidobacteriaceae bacterium]|nr:two-component sensory box histidine kinase/response regulator [Acidobacteriaceae bacterium]